MATDLAIRGKGLEAKLRGLTDKQRRFVLEYLVDLKQTEAARRAGYKAPAVAATKLMKKKAIQRALRQIIRPKLEALEITAEGVLRELAYALYRDPVDLTNEDGIIALDDLRKLPKSIRACIDGIKTRQRDDPVTGGIIQTVELKLTSKMDAIKLAMGYLRLLGDGGLGAGKEATIDWEKMYEPTSAVSDVVDGEILSVEESK